MALNETVQYASQVTDKNFGYYFMISVVTIAIAAIVILIFYFERKYPKKEKKVDPFVKALTVTIVFMLIGWLWYTFGDQGIQDWVKKHWYILIILFAVVFMFYIFMSIRNRPIPFYKLYTKYALPEIQRVYEARPYSGMALFECVLAHKVGVEGRGELMDLVDNMLLVIEGATVFTVLISLNVTNGANIRMIKNPGPNVVNMLIGKEAVAKLRAWEAAFGEEDEEYVGTIQQQPKQPRL